MANSHPRRGEVYWVDWQGGAEPYEKTRPSLVVQNNVGNRVSRNVIIVPITKTIKDHPFMVRLSAGEGGLTHEGCVDCAAIYTIPQDHLRDKIGELSPKRMASVNKALAIALDIPI